MAHTVCGQDSMAHLLLKFGPEAPSLLETLGIGFDGMGGTPGAPGWRTPGAPGARHGDCGRLAVGYSQTPGRSACSCRSCCGSDTNGTHSHVPHGT